MRDRPFSISTASCGLVLFSALGAAREWNAMPLDVDAFAFTALVDDVFFAAPPMRIAEVVVDGQQQEAHQAECERSRD